MKGFGAYLWLEIRRTMRNPRYIMFTIGFPVGFYLIFTSIYGGATLGSGSAAVTFAAQYMVAMAVYGIMGASLNSNSSALANERATGWSRQLRVTPLAPAAYILSKALMAMLVGLPSLLLVGLLGGLVHHVHLSAGQWVEFFVATWLGTIPFAALGILLGYSLDSQSAQSGSMIVYLGLSLLGGIWFPYQIMPKAMQVLATWLPSYHLASMGWNTVAGHWVGTGNLEVLAIYAVIFGALAMRRYRRDEATEYA